MAFDGKKRIGKIQEKMVYKDSNSKLGEILCAY
jgi:hypothetical protein